MGITFLRCVLWYQSFKLTTSLFSMDLDLEGVEEKREIIAISL